ncbi:CHAD domain-containing protein [Sphingomonas sp. BIUV-7]|uniref:CHAD domain-containing protein n=1 Tax=Sphingomonas natans TaxID=3063330 RepID=A0ABT8Y707_9SPHN|nr:CHAD domain-containing protein [Sphingomonas sp. BIUV-7]MDO6414106.1 CHAD domain-containing protein [Sphingomonas sp. BIUV-7]
MASEIELKLDVSREAALAIEGSPLLVGEPQVIDQRAIYFDTPENGLRKAGLSLRIRRSGEQRVQTVKAAGGGTAGLFARGEWECPVDGDQPRLDETNPIRAIVGDAVERIEPRFEVRIERHLWMVQEGASTIELVIDRGETIAADRNSPITEIELELKEGAAADLFALARRLDARAPVRPGVLTKSERGYRLSDEVRSSFKAEPAALDDGMTSAEAFQRIVYGCVRHFRLNEAALFPDRNPDTLHQARVALRRLRSAFSIFASIVRGAEAERLRGQLRGLAADLGDARNLDVLLDHTEAGSLRDRIFSAREDAYDRVEAVLATPSARATMLDLLEWTAAGEWLRNEALETDRCRPIRAHAEGALNRFRKKVKKDGRDLLTADDETRHEVRKDAKKLRYASEFFKPIFQRKREKRRSKKFVAALEELQEQLGGLNDLATAPEVLRLLDPGGHAAAIASDPERKARLIEAADEAYDDLIDAKCFWR